MRIFHWEAQKGNNFFADGYLLAVNREDAEKKLKFVSLHNKHGIVKLDDDCGYDGTVIDENGIAVRWED